jgi:YaiO family outer membrane protein
MSFILNRISRITAILLTTIFSVVATNTFAQDSTSADGLYELARKAAFDKKDYREAIRLSKKALKISPEYADIIVFIGRIYGWSDRPDSARIYFSKALQAKPGLEEAYVAFTDLEYWQDRKDTALTIVNEGIGYNRASVPLLLRKAKILIALKDYENAQPVLDIVKSIDKKNTEAFAMTQRIRDFISKNRIGVSYDYVYFDKQFPDPWQLASLSYTRQTRAGAITARANYANRFNTTGFQYELDAYPRISNTFYSYVNIGYSEQVGVFPKWRGGASLYANLPASFEAEAGIRYLYFTSPTYIYTLYAGKYYSSYLFSIRTYLVPSQNTSKISHSYTASARYYFGGADDFISANIGYGISPDDRPFAYLLNTTYQMLSYRGGLDFRKTIQAFNVIGLNASIINSEFRVGTKGNQVQVGVVYQRRF